MNGKELINLTKEKYKEQKKEFEEILKEEKKEDFVCNKIYKDKKLENRICKGKLIVDLVSGKFYCPRCVGRNEQQKPFNDLNRKLNSDFMLTIMDYSELKHLDSEKLVRVLKIRENQFNYLRYEWEDAVKGNRKAEFFFSRYESERKERKKLNKELNKLKKLIKEIRKNPEKSIELIEEFKKFKNIKPNKNEEEENGI